ncbi:MAG TPA: hypothetical protein VGC22_01080 [Chitinophaga sp.]
MTLSFLYPLALVLHLTGLVLVAGTTLIDYMIFKKFWSRFDTDKSGSAIVLGVLSRLPVLIGIGILLLILSGVTMMALTRGVFGEQVWFRVKFGLVVLICLNGPLVGRRLGNKLRRLMAGNGPADADPAQFAKVRANLTWFHFSQLLFFVLIIVLSVFKFN